MGSYLSPTAAPATPSPAMERSKNQTVSKGAQLRESQLEWPQLFQRDYEDLDGSSIFPVLPGPPQIPDDTPRMAKQDQARVSKDAALAHPLLELFEKTEGHYSDEIQRVLTLPLPPRSKTRLRTKGSASLEVEESPSYLNWKKPKENYLYEVKFDLRKDCYNMDRSRKAFVMCMMKDRPGAEQDIKKIRNWLTNCKFDSISCIDPDKEELMEKLTEFRDGINGIKDDVSCCLVTLMAHGGRGFIKTKLGERVNLTDIFEMFNNKNCPALHGKPRIFLIQACRGALRDWGVLQVDAEVINLKQSEKKRLPTFSDSFIIYSTQYDYVALRNSIFGSVMVQAIDKVFQEHGNRWHIVDFFTRVNNRVTNRNFFLENNPIKVSLVMESTLTKDVYF